MSLFNMFNISASALTAQSARLNAVSSNLANAESVAAPDGQPYRAKQVVFEAVPMPSDGASIVASMSVTGSVGSVTTPPCDITNPVTMNVRFTGTLA